MVAALPADFPPVHRLASSYTIWDRYELHSSESGLEFRLAARPARGDLKAGLVLLLGYIALVSASVWSEPGASLHFGVYVIGVVVAVSPAALSWLRALQLRNHRPSLQLLQNDRRAVVHGSGEQIPFQELIAVCDFTWVDHEGQVYSELQICHTTPSSSTWLLAGQQMGPASGTFRDAARILAEQIGAVYYSFDSRSQSDG